MLFKELFTSLPEELIDDATLSVATSVQPTKRKKRAVKKIVLIVLPL